MNRPRIIAVFHQSEELSWLSKMQKYIRQEKYDITDNCLFYDYES